jgi:hypothetical protein
VAAQLAQGQVTKVRGLATAAEVWGRAVVRAARAEWRWTVGYFVGFGG